MSATTTPLAGTRERWRMSIEARALLLVTAVLMTFGLAVLYSASALQAISTNSPGHSFVLRQFSGLTAGSAMIDSSIPRCVGASLNVSSIIAP